MATEIVMPKLGLTMTEGTVEKWLVEEGDQVEQGDPSAEISSEKLTNEVEATTSGTVIKLVAQEGDVIPSKGAIAYIGEEGETVETGADTEDEADEGKDTKEASQDEE